MTIRDFDIRPLHLLVIAGAIGVLLSGVITADMWQQPSKLWSPGIVFALAVGIALCKFTPTSLQRIGERGLVTVVTYYLAALSFVFLFCGIVSLLHPSKNVSAWMVFTSLFPSPAGGLLGGLITIGIVVFLSPLKIRFRRWRRAILGGVVGGIILAVGFELMIVLDAYPFIRSWPVRVIWLASLAASFGYGIEVVLAWEDQARRSAQTNDAE